MFIGTRSLAVVLCTSLLTSCMGDNCLLPVPDLPAVFGSHPGTVARELSRILASNYTQCVSQCCDHSGGMCNVAVFQPPAEHVPTKPNCIIYQCQVVTDCNVLSGGGKGMEVFADAKTVSKMLEKRVAATTESPNHPSASHDHDHSGKNTHVTVSSTQRPHTGTQKTSAASNKNGSDHQAGPGKIAKQDINNKATNASVTARTNDTKGIVKDGKTAIKPVGNATQNSTSVTNGTKTNNVTTTHINTVVPEINVTKVKGPQSTAAMNETKTTVRDKPTTDHPVIATSKAGQGKDKGNAIAQTKSPTRKPISGPIPSNRTSSSSRPQTGQNSHGSNYKTTTEVHHSPIPTYGGTSREPSEVHKGVKSGNESHPAKEVARPNTNHSVTVVPNHRAITGSHPPMRSHQTSAAAKSTRPHTERSGQMSTVRTIINSTVRTPESHGHGGAGTEKSGKPTTQSVNVTAGNATHRSPQRTDEGLPQTQSLSTTATLIIALAIGCFFFVITVLLLGRKFYDGWKKRNYSRIERDYLIEGMYDE